MYTMLGLDANENNNKPCFGWKLSDRCRSILLLLVVNKHLQVTTCDYTLRVRGVVAIPTTRRRFNIHDLIQRGTLQNYFVKIISIIANTIHLNSEMTA